MTDKAWRRIVQAAADMFRVGHRSC